MAITLLSLLHSHLLKNLIIFLAAVCCSAPAAAQQSRILALGEASHGNTGYNEARMQYLEEHCDSSYKHIFFESSFVGAAIARIRDLDYTYYVYPFWKSADIRPGMISFIDQHARTHFGIDLQEYCHYRDFNQLLLDLQLVPPTTENRNRMRAIDSFFHLVIGNDAVRKGRKACLSEEESKELISLLTALQVQLNKDMDAHTGKLLFQCMENRKFLAHFISMPHFKDRIPYRDSVMAVNVQFLADEVFSKGNCIIWSANSHIEQSGNRNMVSYLQDLYTIKSVAFSNHRGKKDAYFSETIVIDKAKDKMMSKDAFMDYDCP